MEISYALTKGKIRVNTISHVINSENFHVFELDLMSKYPGEIVESTTDGRIDIMICSTSRTLYADEYTHKATSFTIFVDGPGGDWNVMTSSSKYIVNIAIWKVDSEDYHSIENVD